MILGPNGKPMMSEKNPERFKVYWENVKFALAINVRELQVVRKNATQRKQAIKIAQATSAINILGALNEIMVKLETGKTKPRPLEELYGQRKNSKAQPEPVRDSGSQPTGS